jgi:hypothetical protein
MSDWFKARGGQCGSDMITVPLQYTVQASGGPGINHGR